MKLDLGCGTITPEGYDGVDAFNTSQATYTFNFGTTTYPFEDNTIDAVRMSHSLEHLNKQQMYFCFHEVYRVLKKGGEFEIIVPELTSVCKMFCNAVTLTEKRTALEYLFGHNDERSDFQNIQGAIHYNGFDEQILRDELEKRGFKFVSSNVTDYNNKTKQLYMTVKK